MFLVRSEHLSVSDDSSAVYKEPCRSLILLTVKCGWWFASECKKIQPAEINCHLIELYGEGVMNEGNVHKWCRLFSKGRTNAHEEARTIWAPVCHHWGVVIDRVGKTLSGCFSICFLQHCQCSPSVRKDLCKMASKNTHRGTQAETHSWVSDVFGVLPQGMGMNSWTILWQEMRYGAHMFSDKPKFPIDSFDWDRKSISFSLIFCFVEKFSMLTGMHNLNTRSVSRAFSLRGYTCSTTSVNTLLQKHKLLQKFRLEILDHPPYSPDQLLPFDFHLFTI